MPNQDAVRCADVAAPFCGLVAAVADGHGGRPYVRSGLGAHLAVALACEVGTAAVGYLGSGPDESSIRTQLSGPVVEGLVLRWRAQVTAHLGNHPFSTEEFAHAGAALTADPHLAYGCTVLVGLFGPDWVGLVQIGDGDITVVRGELTSAPIPADDRLVGGQTTSLALPSAMSDARVAAITGQLPELVVLTSDGYGNSFVSPDWQQDVGTDLAALARRNGLEPLAEQLPGWLAESSVASGDDVTMALVHRRG